MTELGKAPVEPSVEPVAPTEVKAERDSVALETHRKLLDEKKKLQLKVEAFEAKQKELEEADARKRGDLEAILKSREDELAKEREKRISLETTFERGQKLNAVIDALGGNLDPKWYRLIDVSKVPLNPETGEADQMSVANLVEALKKEWPEMVKHTGSLPSAAPKGLPNGSGAITRSEWMKLPYAKMREYKPNQIID